MNKKPLKIAVLFGGTSEERDVSITSAAQIIPTFRAAGHHVLAIDTNKGLLSSEEEKKLLSSNVPLLPPEEDSLAAIRNGSNSLLVSPLLSEIDIVFLALHGGTGEDGTIQALLDLTGYAYTGSGHVGSSIAMDKEMTKQLLCSIGILTPEWFMVPDGFTRFDEVITKLGLPVVVKPNRQGSTIGLTVVRELKDLPSAVALARSYDSEVMIEKFIFGRELTVGVLNNAPLAVGEVIMDKGAVFDYAAKYQPNQVKEIFPADIPNDIENLAKDLSLKAHKVLKLEGYSRSDFRLDDEGNLWCLEVNSLPGMTPTSLLPQSAKACGISFLELCERICELGMERKKRSSLKK